MNEYYLFKNIEKNVQKYWYSKKVFKVIKNINVKKYYVLCMIPYPSGNLHMGHVRNYTIGDIISRYQRMNGKNVMQPMGWDAFGLPAEISAIKNNILPSIWTYKNIKNMKNQLKSLGFSYDWNREIITCKPEYYKWEQWFFIKLYEKKLIYKKKSFVNWCKYDKTVLANEQVVNGNCWRCDNKIKKKKLYQWFLKISIYAEQLLNDLKYLKYWPIKVISMQKNWIGKTKKILVFFNIFNSDKKIIICIDHLDILINVTYVVISLNNSIAIEESKKNNNINKFILKYNNKKLNNFKKVGIFSNLFVIHPISKEKLPLWIVNFVLSDNINKSNAAIPKYNKYDFFFAKKYNININILILNKYISVFKNKKKFFLNLYKFNLLNIKKKRKIILNELIKINLCKIKMFYKLLDWNISRQRYWGTPIPIININNNIIPISENNLPIVLPENIFKNNTINFIKNNLNLFKFLINNQLFKFEIDTFDTFIESSWYYLRYSCPKYNKNIVKLNSINYWLPVDQYIGGIEHAIMHLLYFRFFHKIFRDFGLVNYNEPVKKLICQGMVLSHTFYYLNKKHEKIWISKNQINIDFDFKKKKIEFKNIKKKKIEYAGMIKMSKSKNNGVELKQIIKKYGSDTIRLFIIFASPIETELEWKEFQLIGIYRFLKRFWKIIFNHVMSGKIRPLKIKKLTFNQKKNFLIIHKLIYEVNYDIKYRQSFNTAISKIMKFINKLNYLDKNKFNKFILHEYLLILIRLLYPFVPHICFKIWKLLGEKTNIDFISWPISNKKFLIKKLIITIQINSKFYNKLMIKSNYNKEFILNIIKNKFFFKKNILNNIYKIIYVKKKLFNIILKN
ncbi:MAG: leucine--tRNA ligase [Enterobacteriaceae bacterium PSmelAO3-2]|nr:leucine--tRNA ligase [Enterobacteriaceae bacterium Cmel17]WMC17491.1 MAG: leucine--tRNA ligase [Enterobacteriaceae bacterium Cmel21]WMC17698.1 MAG: leucine--tRNA ligase [Enterobacteriaceae bacterium PSmelAO3-2]WMC17902.1 MAG: leucine--tRNA ligase [Enterobacteriaceae bacterium PSmelAO3-1]WMC18105.1 MAG: leucine--tRNA ligase [Enterobacteriaceae bacterium PSmelAO1]